MMVSCAHLCILVTGLCVCAAFSRVPGALGPEEQIKKFVYNNNGFGAYSFEFETSDGTYRREDGGMSSGTGPQGGMAVRGEYGYTDPSGRHHLVRYIADANGFQPLPDEDTRFNDRRFF